MRKTMMALIAACALTAALYGQEAVVQQGDFLIQGTVLVEYTGKGGDVIIPDGITTIGMFAFSGCTGLTSITIPEGIITIGEDAFSGCTGLTSITIPEGVTTIGALAFGRCTGLTSITIPESVTTIGQSAFYHCDNVTSITIPASVTAIGFGAFSFSSSLTSITVDTRNNTYVIEAGILFTKDKTKLVWYPANKQDQTYAIPEGIITIEGFAFAGCSQLTSITIPASVTTIGACAFMESGITSLTIPRTVSTIDRNTFALTHNLQEIRLERGYRLNGAFLPTHIPVRLFGQTQE